MNEYTYKDVIIDPEDPRVEIGAYYYYGVNAVSALERANEGKNEKKLTWIYNGDDFDQQYIFGFNDEKYGDGMLFTSFLIRKKEPSYEDRQAEWVKENNIKVGDWVKIVRKFSRGEDGFGYCFIDKKMEILIGKICKINSIDIHGIYVYDEDESDCYLWPYFCLEKVEEPEKKYVPFDLSKEEDRAKLRGAWVRKKEAPFLEQEIAGLSTNVQLVFLNDVISVGVFNLLEEYEFTDGTPCGKLVEDE